MAEHGTRTMYSNYGCRCDECCRAEHRQYLKRKESQARKRTNSKWSNPDAVILTKANRALTQKKSNARRWQEFKSRPSTHAKPMTWQELADRFDMKCAICGKKVNPNDTWIGKNGRKCYGRSYPTVDHIIPLRYGGADVMENVQLACKHCNSVKGVRHEFAI